jgi:hypothetical protein
MALDHLLSKLTAPDTVDLQGIGPDKLAIILKFLENWFDIKISVIHGKEHYMEIEGEGRTEAAIFARGMCTIFRVCDCKLKEDYKRFVE